MDRKDRWLILSSVFLTLGGVVGSIYMAAVLVKVFAPGVLGAHETSFGELLTGMLILLLVILLGALTGAVVFILIWRPFVPRERLKKIVTQPYVPVVTPLLTMIFELIYPAK